MVFDSPADETGLIVPDRLARLEGKHSHPIEQMLSLPRVDTDRSESQLEVVDGDQCAGLIIEFTKRYAKVREPEITEEFDKFISKRIIQVIQSQAGGQIDPSIYDNPRIQQLLSESDSSTTGLHTGFYL